MFLRKLKNQGRLPCKGERDYRRLVKKCKLSILSSFRYSGWETNGFTHTDMEVISLIYRLARAKSEALFNINLLKQNIKSGIAKETGEDNEKGKINNN